jgi:hypothetical protein
MQTTYRRLKTGDADLQPLHAIVTRLVDEKLASAGVQPPAADVAIPVADQPS